MQTDDLITKVSRLMNEHERQQEASAQYNPLLVSGAAAREVQMCRLIGELLNPRGIHGYNESFLELFLKSVLRFQMDPLLLNKTKVELEYLIDENRRIDIVIRNSKYFIPIEVKIGAGDQQNQCADYLMYARGYDDFAVLYYLTLDGHKPSEQSIHGNDVDSVQCISFEKDIVPWLDKCHELAIAKNKKDDQMPVVIKQLLYAIERLSNTEDIMEGYKMEDIRKMICSSKENLHTAMKIEECIVKTKVDFLKSVFFGVESTIDNLPPKQENKYDYASVDYALVHRYYEKRSCTYPGITYLIQQLQGNSQLCLRLELGDRKMYAGYVVTDTEGNPLVAKDLLDKGLIPKGIQQRVSNWWVFYKYLEENDVDYRVCNEEYLSAYNEDGKCKISLIQYYVNELTELWNKAQACQLEKT